MKRFDFVVVGSGLFGATFAYFLKKQEKKVLVIERRNHIGGNIYCDNIEGINVHKYGAHIFHTSNKKIWDFVNSFVEFNRFTNSPLANYKGNLYNLPFNMNTFYQLWGVKTPTEAIAIIQEQVKNANIKSPQNLEEQAISLVGHDIYHLLIKEYTEKQWGRKATKIPAFIIKRLPVRFTFDNNYFNDKYQGIPIGGYNKLIEGLLNEIEVVCNTDYLKNKIEYDQLADKIVYTGPLDEYYNYCFGKLEYRSLKFEHEVYDISNFQGNAVINYTDSNTPYTRIIEHKHFEFGNQEKTVITKEYSVEWSEGDEPYYPISDERNVELYKRYFELSRLESNLVLGGRLAEYKYYDMDKVIESAFSHFIL